MKNIIIVILILIIGLLSIASYSLYKENKDNKDTLEIQHELIINFYELDVYKTELIKNYELMFKKDVDSI